MHLTSKVQNPKWGIRLEQPGYATLQAWALGVIALAVSLIPMPIQAQGLDATVENNSEPQVMDAPSEPLRVRTDCPTELDTLMRGLLRDLPGYTNRVHQRSSGPYRDIQLPGLVLIASQPDFRPLNLNNWDTDASATPTSQSPESEILYQVFFTTLEHQHTEDAIARFQRYHWVFLTRSDETENDWRLAFMYSSMGDYPVGDYRPPTPPEETSYSAVGQGLRLWLRDCRARAVDPIH